MLSTNDFLKAIFQASWCALVSVSLFCSSYRWYFSLVCIISSALLNNTKIQAAFSLEVIKVQLLNHSPKLRITCVSVLQLGLENWAFWFLLFSAAWSHFIYSWNSITVFLSSMILWSDWRELLLVPFGFEMYRFFLNSFSLFSLYVAI